MIKRAFNEPLLLLAAFGSILLATSTLVALTMYASSVADVGVRRIMETASIRTTAATISAPVTAESFPAIERSVREATAKAYSGVPLALTLSIRSDSYVVPGQERLDRPELFRFGSYDGLDRHAKLVDGAWPAAQQEGDIVEAAVSLSAASAAELKAGQVLTTRSRIDQKPVKVRISGVFQLNETFGDRWAGEALLSRGVEVGDFTTYGPLMVGRDTFLTHFATNVNATWTAVPDLGTLSPERLRPFAAGVAELKDTLARSGCPACATGTRLPEMLAQLDTASLVARSTMLIPVLQLLLLAAYALMLTARLLADHRRMEVALLRSRGAGTVRLALLAGAEALLVAVPCALVAPFLGPPLLALINALPWIKSSGVRLAPTADAGTFAVSAAVALASAVLLALPALGGARRTYVDEQSARGRSGGRGLVQRAGADVALLAVAALAVWQLQHYGGPVTSTAGGDLGIDPLIVSGPALSLLCGGMLGLRLVPRVSKLAERITSRRDSLAPALGAWQVSRRPLRYSGPALLLTMAIAIGVVSLATAATWRSSQRDQAVHQASADLRISGPPEARELGVFGRSGAFATLPGVTHASPAFRGEIEFAGETATLLALEGGSLDEVFRLRSDLSDDGVAVMGERLGAARPEIAGLAVPGRPERLTLDVRVAVERAGAAGPYQNLPLRMTVQDARGTWREVQAGPLKVGANRVEVDLRALTGRSGELSYPLTVRGFTAQVPVPDPPSTVTVTLERAEAGGSALALAPGTRWAHHSTGGLKPEEKVGGDGGALWSLTVPGTPAAGRAGEAQTVTLLPAPATIPDAALFAPARRPEARIFKPLPVVLTTDLATQLRLSVGQVAPVSVEHATIQIKVAGIVERMPGTAPDQPAVLADWTTLQGRALAGGQFLRPATEWWLATSGGDTAAAKKVLESRPEWAVTVVDLPGLAAELRDDPLASGLQGALTLGFLSALVFAALGFLVNAAVAARERLAEFAILRALGVSFRQVFALLAIEQTFVIGLSLVAGTGLALVVGALVVPHIVLTGQASAVTPGVLLDIPWPSTLLLLALVAALLFAIVAALARTLRRQGLGQVLRIGEEQ
ncbi:ABC transporter permease [Nonomuraea sp. NPDC046570]|uniref:ABC transporter permease n=1 Tax=Nonomuraea sp. NPDC046570 TaxID=3155255 RepID=UPI0033FD8698